MVRTDLRMSETYVTFNQIRDIIGEGPAMEMVKGWGGIRFYIPGSVS